MSSSPIKDIDIKKSEEYKDSNEAKNENNKNLYIKFMALKNGLIEERKKTTLLEKENSQLKEEIQKNQELILDLKDEIKKYHNAINKNGNSNFFSELFNNINISGIKNEVTIEKLNSENFQLKEEISQIKNELNETKTKLDDSISKNNIKINEYEKQIKDIETSKEKIILENKNEIEKMKKTIMEYDIKNRKLEETISILTSDRKYFEENINKLKQEIRKYKDEINKKNEEIRILFQEQENVINNNSEFQQKVDNLKNLISQYKKAIDNCTDIHDDYIFIGKIIPNTHYNNIINIQKENNINDDIFLKVENKINDINSTENYQKIKIKFDFYKRRINIKIEKQKQINLEVKNIIDIVQNLHVEGQIKIFYKIKDNVFDYLCQFTKKEADFLIYFYKELKNQDKIDPALIGLSMGTI